MAYAKAIHDAIMTVREGVATGTIELAPGITVNGSYNANNTQFNYNGTLTVDLSFDPTSGSTYTVDDTTITDVTP